MRLWGQRRARNKKPLLKVRGAFNSSVLIPDVTMARSPQTLVSIQLDILILSIAAETTGDRKGLTRHRKDIKPPHLPKVFLRAKVLAKQ